MAVDPLQKIMMQQSWDRRINGMSNRQGWVHEVGDGKNAPKDMVRVCMGIRGDGSPWLSPWIHTTNMRGGARERRMFKVGQNVRLSSQGGDMMQSTVSHWAENKSFPAPDQADSVNGESYQMGSLRVSKSDSSSYNIWMADSNNPTQPHQGQTGQPETGQASDAADTGGGGGGGGGDATMAFRVSNDGGITGRIGKGDSAMRFQSHKDGVKIKAKGGNVLFVTKDGVFTSKPLKISKDTIPDDDEFNK